MGFEPKLVGFLCEWCSYAGADLAGTSRISYPENLHVVRMPCSCRVDPTFVLEALRCGADGVLVCGCPPGDCHYVDGNYKALRRFEVLRELLGPLGIEPSRVRLEWISANEAQRFADVVTAMVARLRELGPSPVGRAQALDAAER